MKHPTSELVDLVDGTLPPGERAVVDAHLVTCHACRREVAEATAARQLLSQLTPAPVPPGLMEAVLAGTVGSTEAEVQTLGAARAARAGRAAGGRGAGQARMWARWASVAGAAAAVILVAGIVLPNVKGTDGVTRAGNGYEADANASFPATVVEIVDQELDAEELQALALGYAAAEPGAAAGAEASPQTVAAASSQVIAARTDASAAAVARARACVASAFGEPAGTYVRLIEARFQGTPAVVGVVLSGPGAGQPADTVDVLVAARGDCSILWSVTVRL